MELALVAEVVVQQAARDPGLLGQCLDRQLVEAAVANSRTPSSSSCSRRLSGAIRTRGLVLMPTTLLNFFQYCY